MGTKLHFLFVAILLVVLNLAVARAPTTQKQQAFMESLIKKQQAIGKQMMESPVTNTDQQVLISFRRLLQITRELKRRLHQGEPAMSEDLAGLSEIAQAVWKNKQLYQLLAKVKVSHLVGPSASIYNEALAEFEYHLASMDQHKLLPVKIPAVMAIIQYPDKRLFMTASPVKVFDDALKELTQRMLATMYKVQGVGLAAPQVGISQREFVMDASTEQNQPMIFINPKLTAVGGKNIIFPEGCLSIARGLRGVTRSAQMHINAQDCEGKSFSMEVGGLAAVVMQHEVDHLNGKLIIDHPLPARQALGK